MTTIVDRVPIERITAEANQVQVGRTLLTLIAGLFYLIGWTLATLIRTVVWCFIAVKVGYLEAGGPVPQKKAGRPHGPTG